MPAPESRLETFAAEFAAALQDRGMTLSGLQLALTARGEGVSNATLSYWRSGARRPESERSLRVVTAIEDILGVVPGRLKRHLTGRTRRVGSVAESAPEPESGERGEVFAALAVSPLESLRMLSVQETVSIDAAGAIASVESVLLLQCIGDRVDSIAMVDTASDPTDVSPHLRVVAGGSLVREVTHPQRQLFGFAVALPRRLERGDTAMLSWIVTYPDGYPSRREHMFSARAPVREVIRWYRFDEARVPDWADEDERTGPVRRLRDVELSSSQVHRVSSDFGPGSIRMRWGWEDD